MCSLSLEHASPNSLMWQFFWLRRGFVPGFLSWWDLLWAPRVLWQFLPVCGCTSSLPAVFLSSVVLSPLTYCHNGGRHVRLGYLWRSTGLCMTVLENQWSIWWQGGSGEPLTVCGHVPLLWVRYLPQSQSPHTGDKQLRSFENTNAPRCSGLLVTKQHCSSAQCVLRMYLGGNSWGQFQACWVNPPNTHVQFVFLINCVYFHTCSLFYLLIVVYFLPFIKRA